MNIVFAAACVAWKDNNKNEVALIHRRSDYPHHLRDKWFLPGGKIEPNEQPAEAAIRETKEECGLIVNEPKLVDVYAYTERWQDEGEDKMQRVILAIYEGVCTDFNQLSISDETQDSAWVELEKIRTYISNETIETHLTTPVKNLLKLN